MNRKILFGFLTFYGLTMSGEFFFGDGNELTQIADNLLKQGSLTLPEDGQAFSGRNAIISPTSERYSKFGIGLPILEVPFLYAGNQLASLLIKASVIQNYQQYLFINGFFLFGVTSFISAWICYIFFQHLKFLGFSEKTCLITTLLLGIGSIVWPASKRGHTEPLQGLLLLTAWYGLLRSVNSTKPQRWLILSGGCLGYGLITKISFAINLPIYFVYAFFLWLPGTEEERWVERVVKAVRDLKFWKYTLALTFPVLLGLCLVLYYNYLRMGNAFVFGYAISGSIDAFFGFSNALLAGLYGLLLSPGKSIFLYSPPLVLICFSAKRLLRRFPKETWFVAGIVSANLILFSKWYVWSGDFFWGPRLTIIFVPLVMVGVAEFVETCLSTITTQMKWGFILFCAIGFYINLIGVCFNNTAFQYSTYYNSPFQMVYKSDLSEIPLINDAFHLHFIPEYSPILGHHWIFKHKILRLFKFYDSDGEYRKALIADVPWKTFNAKWIPHKNQLNFEWDFWFVKLYKLFFTSKGIKEREELSYNSS